MSNPGYGPNGFKVQPVGLSSWDGQAPPVLKPNSNATRYPTMGLGRIPRRVLDMNEPLRVKEY